MTLPIESAVAASALLSRPHPLPSGRALRSLTRWLWTSMAVRLPDSPFGDGAVDHTRGGVIIHHGARAWARFVSACGGTPVWLVGAPGMWSGILVRNAVVPGAGDFDLVCRSRLMCAFVSHEYPDVPVIVYEGTSLMP